MAAPREGAHEGCLATPAGKTAVTDHESVAISETEFPLYQTQTEDEQTHVDVRFSEETAWFLLKQMEAINRETELLFNQQLSMKSGVYDTSPLIPDSLIKQKYLEDRLSIRDIARFLDAMKIPTKRQGKGWHNYMVIKILEREGVYVERYRTGHHGWLRQPSLPVREVRQ